MTTQTLRFSLAAQSVSEYERFKQAVDGLHRYIETHTKRLGLEDLNGKIQDVKNRIDAFDKRHLPMIEMGDRQIADMMHELDKKYGRLKFLTPSELVKGIKGAAEKMQQTVGKIKRMDPEAFSQDMHGHINLIEFSVTEYAATLTEEKPTAKAKAKKKPVKKPS